MQQPAGDLTRGHRTWTVQPAHLLSMKPEWNRPKFEVRAGAGTTGYPTIRMRLPCYRGAETWRLAEVSAKLRFSVSPRCQPDDGQAVDGGLGEQTDPFRAGRGWRAFQGIGLDGVFHMVLCGIFQMVLYRIFYRGIVIVFPWVIPGGVGKVLAGVLMVFAVEGWEV